MRSATFFAIFALSLTGLIEAYDPVKMLCLVNQQRQRSGRKPLGMSKALENAAQKHSDDQARMRSMTHTGSDGSSPGDRVSRAGYNWNGVAENVAYGYSDEEECMKQWMNSPGHRENILGDYTHFGSAVSRSGNTPYYTQDFGKQSGSYGNFPVCPSGAAYDTTTDSAPSSDYSSGGNTDYSGGSSPSSGNYGGSAPSSSPRKYSSGGRSPSSNYGGSSPSSGNYGGRSPSSGNRYTPKKHNHKKSVKSYGGNVQDTNDYGVKDSNQSRKPAYGNKKYGNVNDSNDIKPAYGNKVTYNGVKDSNQSRKPAYGPQSNSSYGNNDNSYGRRHGGNKSYGSNKGHSHGGRYGGRGRDD